MTNEQRQVHLTAVFLRTSFDAIKSSMAGKLEDALPCWLDASMLMMLNRELHGCYRQAKPLFDTQTVQLLALAAQQCDVLLAQCPGLLNSTLCHRHLDAILTPLQAAMQRMSAPLHTPRRRLWPLG
ncbi:hypothetical protein R5M92_10720 [Halomonas sp. Bachu 37]|uniref:hypothetical protein n=1 Tax=Halomonas kashgarensis TaxID=3084920 RepID=UPI00321673E7